MFLKKWDFLSPQITLHFEGHLRHSSIFSGVLSIIAYLAIFSTSILFLTEVHFKTSAKAFYRPQYFHENINYGLGKDELFHFITFTNYTILNLTKIKVVGEMKVYTNMRQLDPDYDYMKELDNDYWEYGPCKDSFAYTNFSNFQIGNSDYYKTYFSSALCIVKYINKLSGVSYNVGEEGFLFPQISFGGNSKNPVDYYIYIMIKNNDVEENEDNLEDIIDKREEYLKQLEGYTLHFVDILFDMTDYYKPFQRYFYNISNIFESESFSLNTLNFSPLVLKTNKGYILNNIESLSSYLFNSNKRTYYLMSFSGSTLIGSYLFSIDNRAGVYERDYVKLQDSLYKIGSLSNVIFSLAFYFNLIFNDYVVFSDLSRIFTTPLSTPQNKCISLALPKINNFPLHSISSSGLQKIKHSNKKSKKKKITLLNVILYRLNCQTISFVQGIFQNRAKIISEEKMMKMYFVLNSLDKHCAKSSSNSQIEGLLKQEDSKNILKLSASRVNMDFDGGAAII